MRQRNIEDGILLRIEHAADLFRPLIPRPLAPEIVDVEKTTLDEVFMETLDLGVAQAHHADVLHLDPRTVEQGVVCQAHHQMIGIAVDCLLTRVFVSSDKRIEKLMSASG